MLGHGVGTGQGSCKGQAVIAGQGGAEGQLGSGQSGQIFSSGVGQVAAGGDSVFGSHRSSLVPVTVSELQMLMTVFE